MTRRGSAGTARWRLAVFTLGYALLGATAAVASTCESLRAEIETRIAASGVARFSVTVVEAEMQEAVPAVSAGPGRPARCGGNHCNSFPI